MFSGHTTTVMMDFKHLDVCGVVVLCSTAQWFPSSFVKITGSDLDTGTKKLGVKTDLVSGS